MKLITKSAVKRLGISAVVLIIGYLIFISCCSVIETPPYVAKKLAFQPFMPGKSGNGELAFDPAYQQVPILVLRGTPREMGQQQGALLKPQLNVLVENYLNRFLSKDTNKQRALDGLKEMKPFIPPEYLQEIEAISQASGESLDNLLLLHTIIDEPRMPFCSVVIASGPATVDGGLIFGRNLDFPSLGIAKDYSLITVFHPIGKKPFAAITWPGYSGVISGINRDGLSLAMLISMGGVTNLSGIPSILLFRKALEEASDIDGVIKVVRSARRTAPTNLAVADAQGKSAVIEFTSTDVQVRHPEKGLLYSTNWFLSDKLRQSDGDWRYDKMATSAQQAYGRIDVPEVIRILGRVPLRLINLQSMVFVPKDRVVYFSAGQIPAAKGEFRHIDLAPYLK
jgi:predicted choloylglycine hydrolase